MIIYKIKNKITGKLYIGQTSQPIEKRWSQHLSNGRRGSRTAISKAIKAYGPDVFEISIICRCLTIEEMNRREKYCISVFKTLVPNGYNLDSGGSNKKMHDLTRKKLSMARLGKKIGPFSQEHKQKISLANKGKNKGIPLSDDTKKKLSEALSGSKNPMFGKKRTREEMRGAIEKNTGNKYWSGRKHSDNAKHKMSKSQDKNKKPVFCVTNNTLYESVCEAARSIGISAQNIRQALKRNNKTTKNFTFKYDE